MISIPSIHLGNSNATSRTKKKKSSAATGFSGYMSDTEEVDQPKAAALAASVTATNPLLSIQEISDDEMTTRKEISRGHAMLDQLEQIRFALMSGGIPLAMLHDVEALVSQQRATTNDEKLNDLLDEIELRVAVERAKLEMALQRSE